MVSPPAPDPALAAAAAGEGPPTPEPPWPRRVLAILADAGSGWLAHDASRMGAALAFYSASSLGPLLLIAIAIAGAVFGRDAAQDRIFADLHGLLGAPAAAVVQQAVAGAARPGASTIATIAGVVLLLVTASAVFGELHAGMNTIWAVKPPPTRGTLWAFTRDRLISFAMVFGLGFILLASLLLTAVLAAVGPWLDGFLPGGGALWEVVTSVVSFFVTSFVFGVLFRFVPDLRVNWRHALIAGVVTSLLFTLGRLGLGLYLRLADVGSAYGAAASVIVLLVWVYYFAQIVYFGAELSRALGLAKLKRVRASRARCSTG